MSILGLAQKKANPQVFNPDRFSPLSRLHDREIQSLLKIDEKQKETLAGIQRNWQREFNEFSDLPTERRDRKKLREILAKYEKRAAETLSSEQRKNVFGLTTLTYFGVPALKDFRRETYRNELALNEEQIGLINSLYRQWLGEGLALLNKPENEQKDRRRQLEVLQSFNEKWDASVSRQVSLTFSTEQKTRFGQLKFQRQCIVLRLELFAEDSVRSELKLTKEQRQAVDVLIKNLPAGWEAHYRASTDGYEKCVRMLDERQLGIFKAKLGKISEQTRGLLLPTVK